MLSNIIRKNRSYRRFQEQEKIPREVVENWIDGARYVSSAHNLQPLRYAILDTEDVLKQVYQSVQWAAFLKEWNGPAEGERPPVIVCVMADKRVKINQDILMCCAGISCQSILLQAVEGGYGGCIIGAFNAEKIKEMIGIRDVYELLLFIALGRPNEKIVVDEIKDINATKYYRDVNDVHHVPKLGLREVLVELKNKS